MTRAGPTLVWDFAGVLFDWHPPTLIRRELPQRGGEAERWVKEIFQGYGGDWVAFDRGTVEVPDLVRRIAARSGLAEAEVQSVVDAVPRALKPIGATVELLARLRAQGRRLLYLSNMPAPFADHLEAAHEFLGWFDDGVISARVHAVKPERAIFDLAAERFGHDPAELLFFDDHPANVEAARAAGWQAERFTDAAAAAAILRTRGLLKD